MSDHDRIATAIENRYREHSAEARRIWMLKGDGPRLSVQTVDEGTAILRLRGRSRTLANRRFIWTHGGGDGTIMELLGHSSDGKPLNQQLSNIAMTQALRAAVAADMGAGVSSVPGGRVLIDRFTARRILSRDGAGMLEDMARAARAADVDEVTPNNQITMTNAGTLQFSVAPCEADVHENQVRRPQIRMSAIDLPGGASYLHSRLQIPGGSMPETLAIAATGRPLRDIVDTGEPMLGERTVESVLKAGDTLIIRLVEDMVEIREITG